MKDVPHHMTDFLKSFAKEESPSSNECLKEYEREKTKYQRKKQAKIRKRKLKKEHIPQLLTPEEQNKKMKKREPILKVRNPKIKVKNPKMKGSQIF